mmetsp:Transcript_14200/g.39910  ORF Transcript_14200/g.39910 Transcript_14200/m.39910 type:complete len:396 (+) Transcript_14200:3-1190(+)
MIDPGPSRAALLGGASSPQDVWSTSRLLFCLASFAMVGIASMLRNPMIWLGNALFGRYGIALGAPPGSVTAFLSGEGGYHTYRIPALLVLPSGHLLLFCEGRKRGSADDGWIDLVYKRSVDGGKSWGMLQILHSEGDDSTPTTIGNPCPAIVDGRVFIAFSRNNSQVLTLHSVDANGFVWPKTPTDISHQVFGAASVGWVAPGPPGALVLSSGRVLVPYNVGPKVDDTGSGTFFSDDGGRTWSSSNLIPGANECQAAVTADGRLLLNMRMAFSDGARLLAYSHDMGNTWSPPQRWDIKAVECEGSMLSVSRHSGNGSVLFFSQPGVRWIRGDLMLWFSADSGSTWQVARRIQPGPCAYSALQQASTEQLYVVYEIGISSAIRFAVIDIDIPNQHL